jgi:transcriptional regulator of arginine metabolism
LKSKRQAKIKEFITSREIYTQGELTRLLADAGFNVTQATISRDMHELRLTKTAAENGGLKYSLSAQIGHQDMERFNRIFKDGFLSMDYAGNTMVIRTIPGMAMAVAAALDAMKHPEVLGSVAGDDVIICVVRTESQVESLMEKLRK